MNYGHWINLLPVHFNIETMEKVVRENPTVLGFRLDYLWSALEPSVNSYDLGDLLAKLDWCAARGLMVVVLPRDKTFDARLPNPLPTQLHHHGRTNRSGGVSTVRWAPDIVHAFGRLLTRLARLRMHPAFEGIMLIETAPSLESDVLAATDYSPERYADAYCEWLALTDCRIFWQMNFCPPRDEEFMTIKVMGEAPLDLVHIGGPDVLPTNPALLARAYPQWRRFTDNFATMSIPSYSVDNWSIAACAEYARTDLNCSRLFWTYTDNFAEQSRVIKETSRLWERGPA